MSKCIKVANPCKVCLQNVTIKTGIQCKGACKSWVHYKCLNYTPGKVRDVKDGYIKVNCPCPDCVTMTDKDYVAYVNPSCSNSSCPANKLPKCENSGCPVNKKLSASGLPGLPQEKCGKSCKKTQDKSVSSPAKPIPAPISASSSYVVSDSSQKKGKKDNDKKEKPKKEKPKKEKPKNDKSGASPQSSCPSSKCSCATSSGSTQEKGKNENVKKDKPKKEKPKKEKPKNDKSGASPQSSCRSSGCSCATSSGSTQEKGKKETVKKEKPKKEKSKKDKTKASSKTSSHNSELSNTSEGTCGCRSSNGDGGKSGDSPAAAIDEMCNTVGKLTKQINDLMVKMKKSVKEQSKAGCVPSRSNNCTQSGPSSQCPLPCHCETTGKKSGGKKRKFF